MMTTILIFLCVIYAISVIACVIFFWDDICTGKTGLVPYIVAILPIMNTYIIFDRIRYYIRYRK